MDAQPPTKKKRARSRNPPVRPVSRNPGHSRITTLQCFKEVYAKILDGWSLYELAKFIQEERQECPDITRDGLESALNDYRKTIPKAQLISKKMSPVMYGAVQEVREGLDELKEMEKLYVLQMKRIQIDIKNEETIKKLMPTTGQEVRIAREILGSYAELKMDLGLSTRHIGQLDVDARLVADVASKYNRPEVTQVVNDPEARRRVLGLAERLLTAKDLGLSSLGDDESRTVDMPTEPEVVKAEPNDDP